jgi:hypothetical protein
MLWLPRLASSSTERSSVRLLRLQTDSILAESWTSASRQAVGQLRQPCGRCEHDATDHPTLGHGQLADTRGHRCLAGFRGSDCHDFYDGAVAARDPDNQLELAA